MRKGIVKVIITGKCQNPTIVPLQPNTREQHKHDFTKSNLGISVTTVPQELGRESQQSPTRSRKLG